jgi:hypothetical protein
LASCFGSQFACTDGTCQPLDSRCDQRKDCLDGSDELDCSLLKLNRATYIKDYLPPAANPTDRLNIQLTVDILRFLKIEETDFVSSIQFQLHMKWRDTRISFTHLTNDIERNILTEDEKFSIWTPSVVFHNTEDKFISSTNSKTTIIIEKQNDFILSPSSQAWKSKMYKGAENDIHYYDTYSTDFQCDFALNNYPFDTQVCYMIFSLPARVEDLLDLELTEVNNYGDIQLAQYVVADYSIIHYNSSASGNLPDNIPKSSEIVKITFKRRFIYQLFTVYLPTFCLLIIMQSTHYFPNDQFEARVMVSLTGMLVMTTLLLSVSNNLPPTNYIKLIDIWMLFAMVSPFFDIIIHTVKAYSEERINLAKEVRHA